MPNTAYAVLFGDEELLNRTRGWILEKAGCVVLTAKNPGDVEKLCAEYPVQMLILCPPGRKSEAENAIAAAERHRPKVKKLWLCKEEEMILSDGRAGSILNLNTPDGLYLAMRKVVTTLQAEETI